MIDVDDKDRELLAILSADGRISVKTLAARLGLARSTVSQRLAGLEREDPWLPCRDRCYSAQGSFCPRVPSRQAEEIA